MHIISVIRNGAPLYLKIGSKNNQKQVLPFWTLDSCYQKLYTNEPKKLPILHSRPPTGYYVLIDHWENDWLKEKTLGTES
jgi:hypothetical protein